jgi:uncharacterized membrane protein (UPF0182 family)
MDTNKTRQILQGIIIFVVLMIFLSVSKIVTLVTDFLWYSAVGFKEIFMTALTTKIAIFLATAGFFFLFSSLNVWIASLIGKKEEKKGIPVLIKIAIIAAISIGIGFSYTPEWMTVLEYANQSSFSVEEPIFNHDVSFYVFTLPFYNLVWRFLMSTLILSIIIVSVDYLQSLITKLFQIKIDPDNLNPTYNLNFKNIFSEIKKKPLTHLSVLGSFVFLLLAGKHYLSRFSIMYSEKGIVVGAGYTDVMVSLPIIKFMMILALVMTGLFYVYIFYISKHSKLKKRHILFYFLGLYLIFGFVGPTLIPELFQSLWVSPNEINLEKPYIENNIAFTKLAYGLDKVEEKQFNVQDNISREIIEQEPETIDNIRILDRRPLRETYKQTQEIRLYYDLSGIDIDRYTIDGKYTSVLLAPRELDQMQIADNAKTWVNIHTVYTHGYGVVMSPVNSVTEEGLPNYIIKDIPPIYATEEPSIKIERPQIYYGERYNNFVIVNTNTEEFDFPKGNTNEYINYNGKGGVILDSFGKKLLMALKFGDIKILLSSDITTESKIMFRRNILERVKTITPFIEVDSDPYVVINEGKLLWIIDGYTASNNYPYSEKFRKSLNYLRNPVKIVIDAYDGSVTYYVIDREEPIMKTFNKIFPNSFKDYDDMPDSLKKHVRYPKDLFRIQSEIYQTYHMANPTVFYNKEDAWQIPYEVYGVGQQVKTEPYHIIMKLPEEEKEEFILMTSFSPIKKNNMVAWFAARADGENYGKLIVYKFPKDKLIYGPLQIEAKFDQDSEISQQLTLWSQQGSRVTRGNLLIIPIQNNILYIEPLYIQAETGQLPELKRILVSDGERVVMEETLDEALSALFGKRQSSTTLNPEIEIDDEFRTDKQLIQDANNYYNQIMDAMKNNDWNLIGDNFNKLGNVLEKLSTN